MPTPKKPPNPIDQNIKLTMFDIFGDTDSKKAQNLRTAKVNKTIGVKKGLPTPGIAPGIPKKKK